MKIWYISQLSMKYIFKTFFIITSDTLEKILMQMTFK